MLKKTFITSSLLVIAGSLGYGTFVASGLQDKYEETIKWDNSSLLDEIHQVPPSLARNYVTHEEQKLFKVLTEVNISLNEIIRNVGVQKEKKDEYWKLYEEAKSVIAENEELYATFTDKEVMDDFELYLKADQAIKIAYDDFSLESLKEHSEKFSKRLSKRNNEFERSLFEQLRQISQDYVVLEDFSKRILAQLGVVENKLLNVKLDVTMDMTNSILDEIKEKKLYKFKHISRLEKILEGAVWTKIVNHNTTTKEYLAWQEAKAVLEALTKSDYILVGKLKTTKDILDYDPSANLAFKTGYTIDDDSKVLGVYMGDTMLDDELYMKKGSHVWYSIEYKYTKTPEQEALEYVLQAIATRSDEDIATAKEVVLNLRDSDQKEQLLKDIDNLIAAIKQDEIDRIKAEERRKEEEIKRKAEEELQKELEKDREKEAAKEREELEKEAAKEREEHEKEEREKEKNKELEQQAQKEKTS